MYFSIRTYFSEPSGGYCFSTKPVDLLEKQGFQKGTINYLFQACSFIILINLRGATSLLIIITLSSHQSGF